MIQLSSRYCNFQFSNKKLGNQRFFIPIIISIFSLYLNFSTINSTKAQEIELLQNIFWEDTTSSVTFQQIVSSNISKQFKEVQPDLVDGKINSNYWFKFTIKNISGETLFLILPSFLKEAQLFKALGSGKYAVENTGLKYSGMAREFEHTRFLFNIPPHNLPQTYYLKIKVYQPVFLGPIWEKNKKYFNKTVKEFYYHGLFIGLALIIAIYNIIIGIVNKEKIYLFYSGYLLSFIGFALTDWGFIYEFLPEFILVLGQQIFTFFFASMTIFILLYAKSFLQTNKYLPAFNSLINFSIGLRIALFLIGVITNNYTFHSVFIDDLILLIPFFAAIIRFSKGFQSARFLLIGLAVFYVGLIVHTIMVVRIFPQSTFSYGPYLFFILGAIEMIFYSLALADRFRNLKQEKEKNQLIVIEKLKENESLKDKVNLELEQKVEERTKALIEANEKLHEHEREIKRMNLLLSKENEKLGYTIKNISKARVTNKEVTYEEFKEIYPNDEACYKYIMELKWGKEYKCKKCNNEKFSERKPMLLRRCTRCGYDESLTMDTIFHKLRFPISKAFYMLYLVTSKKNMTIDELSIELNLSRQTCWSYKNKINDALGKSKDKFPSWKNLILSISEEQFS